MGATTPARLTGGGDRLRILAHLAWPAIIEQILGTMVSYVDTGMVGVLGATSTAAVATNAASIWLVNGTLAGIGVGYSVQVANAIGAGDPEQAAVSSGRRCWPLRLPVWPSWPCSSFWPPISLSGWVPSRRCSLMPWSICAFTPWAFPSRPRYLSSPPF